MNNELREAANRLARDNATAESRIQEIYLFPSEDEIRLVEIYPEAIPSEGMVEPFYFAPDPEGQIPFRCGIALIRPEEKERLAPPEKWGSWEKAIRIWPVGESTNGAA